MIHDEDVKRIKEHFIPLFNLINSNFYITGGSISDILSHGFVINDYDIIFETELDFFEFETQIVEYGANLACETVYSKVYKFLNSTIDLNKFSYITPIQKIEECDILASCIAISRDYLYTYPESIYDARNRIIRINKFKDSYTHRVKRYLNKGYILENTQNEKYKKYKESGITNFYKLNIQKIKL